MPKTKFDLNLRTPRERSLRKVATVVSAILWVLLAVSIIGAIYGLVIAAVIAMAHALFLAHVRGNGVRIGPNQLPDIWRKVVNASDRLGLAVPPEVYLVQSGGLLNAFATKLLGRRFVILYSQLVDDCTRASRGDGRPDELDFVIAHEVGHLAAGHLNWFLLPVRILPLLGPAYSRACEYSCDRCGHVVVGDLQTSSRALAILAAGGHQAQRIDLDAFVEQRNETGGFWMAVYELNASHPYLPKRIAALREYLAPGSVPIVGRSAASYPLAPFLAVGSGGAAASGMMMIALIGIMAAVAIPAFIKYTERAKAMRARADYADPAEKKTAAVDGKIRGERYAWTMNALGDDWNEVPSAQAHAQNALADRWWTRRDVDAHIVVIAEPRTPNMDLDKLTTAVITNGRNTLGDFKVTKQVPIASGRMLTARATLKSNGTKIAYRYGLFMGTHAMYQVLLFSSAADMPRLEHELEAQLATFVAD